MTQLTRPRGLREILDSGGSLTEMDALTLNLFATDDLPEVFRLPAATRAERAKTDRQAAELFLDTSIEWPPMAPGTPPQSVEHRLSVAQREIWSAEVAEDLELAERAIEALPPRLRAKCRRQIQRFRSPHPLVIEAPDDHDWWECAACGAIFEHGEDAVIIGHRPGFSTKPDPQITYCGRCVAMAAAAMGEATLIGDDSRGENQ